MKIFLDFFWYRGKLLLKRQMDIHDNYWKRAHDRKFVPSTLHTCLKIPIKNLFNKNLRINHHATHTTLTHSISSKQSTLSFFFIVFKRFVYFLLMDMMIVSIKLASSLQRFYYYFFIPGFFWKVVFKITSGWCQWFVWDYSVGTVKFVLCPHTVRIHVIYTDPLCSIIHVPLSLAISS